MIKFFRHIRKSLLMENKTGKYFKYAIGEIVLVVIGILIALQVNNWNNKRIENNRAHKFVNKLNIQIANNLATVTNKIEIIDKRYKNSLELISIIGNRDITNIDSEIDKLIFLNLGDYHLNLNMNIILEGKENGDFTLIASEELRQQLYDLMTINDDVKERELITNEDLNTFFVPYLYKNYNLRNSLVSDILEKIGKSNLYKGDNNKMLQDQEFENFITTRSTYTKSNLNTYYRIKNKLEIIKLLMENLYDFDELLIKKIKEVNPLKPVIITDKTLKNFVGIYEFSPDKIITISKNGNQLKARMNENPDFLINPSSNNVFKLKDREIQFTFNSNDEGKVISLTLLQGSVEDVFFRIMNTYNH